jgi:type IV secretion system protein VirD4
MRRRIRTTPQGAQPYLERRPSPLASLLFFLSGLAFFGALAYGAYMVIHGFGQEVLRVGGEGWARYFGTSDPLQVGAKCFFSKSCTAAFKQVGVAPDYFRALYPIGGALLLAAFASRLVTIQARVKAPGTAKWAEVKDLKPLEKGRQSGYMGFLREETPDGKPKPPKVPVPFPEAIRNGHIAVLGGPGAGKTTAFFLPNLLKDAEDGNVAVVFDFKFPDPTGLGEALSYFEHHGRPVYVFTPFERTSMVLPLLEGGETREGALSIAEMLVPKRLQEGPDEFYRNLERALVMILVYAIANDPDIPSPSPRDLLRYIMEGPEKIRNYIHGHKRSEVREWGRQFVNQLAGMARDKQVGITMGLATKFILFDNPLLASATTRGQGEGVINLKEVFGGENPGILYIGIPQAEIQGGKGQTLLQLIKRLLDRAILEVAHKHGGKLPHHTVFYLDEFPSFGYLPNMTEMLATMRSRRVAYLISLQDHAQGYAVYGKEEFDAMFGTIQTIVAWPSRLTAQDREWYSKLLGKTTALERSYMEGGHYTPLTITERRVSETLKETARELLTVDEMQTFPPEEVVITTPSVPPIRAIAPFLFADASARKNGLTPHPWAEKRKAIIAKHKPEVVLTLATLQGAVVEQMTLRSEEDFHGVLFVTWLEHLLHFGPKVDTGIEGGLKTFTLTRIPKQADLSMLEEFERRGWAIKVPGGFKITAEGVKHLRKSKVETALAWMARVDPVFHLLRKHKDKVGEAIIVREAALYLREDLAGELREEVKRLASRERVNGVDYLVFEAPLLPQSIVQP